MIFSSPTIITSLVVSTECAGVGTPVFIRKGYFFTHGLVKAKRGNVVTVSTAPKDKEKNVVILGRGTQHYAIVEDKVPSPKYVFIGTRVLAMHLDNERYAFAVVTRIKDGKYWVRFEHDNQRRKFTIDFIRILYPPTFCGKSRTTTLFSPGRGQFFPPLISGQRKEFSANRIFVLEKGLIWHRALPI